MDGLVRESARRVPGREAVRHRGRGWTYAELDAAVSTGAAVLRERYGLGDGDRVAVLGRDSDAHLLTFLACARAGLTQVPVAPDLTGGELAHVLADCAPALVLADPDLAGRVPAGPAVRPLRDAPGSFLAELAEPQEFDPDRDPYEVVQLLYPRGTAARSGGTALTHRMLARTYEDMIGVLDLDEADRPLHAPGLGHPAPAHLFLLPCLAVGARNTILDEPLPEHVLGLVEEDRADSLFAPPPVWTALAGHPQLGRRAPDGLRKGYYDASATPGPVLDRLRQRLPGLALHAVADRTP
ncbi:AMP-binding protein [Streptomyces sp. NPDC051567]|uniref:AMP-binding protein n=1 Tax=Streptomyces sp. NPDC051567 TaxID=3365660 RepID=UPI0037A48CDD